MSAETQLLHQKVAVLEDRLRLTNLRVSALFDLVRQLTEEPNNADT